MSEKDQDIALALETMPIATERLAQIELDILAWAEKPIEFSFDPSGTDLFSMEELTRAFAKRAAEFSSVIRRLLADENIIPATVVGRALIETIGTGCLFLHDMNRFVVAKDRKGFETRLGRFYAGRKGGAIEPVHVMDSIRHLQKIDAEYVSYLDNKYDLFSITLKMMKGAGRELSRTEFFESLSAMKNYDLLSEVAHPNGLGTQFVYGQPGPLDTKATQLKARFRQASLMSIWQCHHLLMAFEKNADLSNQFHQVFLQ